MANVSGPQPDVKFCPRCAKPLRNVPRNEMKTRAYRRRDGSVAPRHAHLRMPHLQDAL